MKNLLQPQSKRNIKHHLTHKRWIIVTWHKCVKTSVTPVAPKFQLGCTAMGRKPHCKFKSCPLTFRHRIKYRLPFAGIIKSLPYSTRFQDKG